MGSFSGIIMLYAYRYEPYFIILLKDDLCDQQPNFIIVSCCVISLAEKEREQLASSRVGFRLESSFSIPTSHIRRRNCPAFISAVFWVSEVIILWCPDILPGNLICEVYLVNNTLQLEISLWYWLFLWCLRLHLSDIIQIWSQAPKFYICWIVVLCSCTWRIPFAIEIVWRSYTWYIHNYIRVKFRH